MVVFTECDYGENLNERVKEIPHVTVFDLMATIYNYLSECYARDDIYGGALTIKVLTDDITDELLAELEGLEP